MINVTNGAVSVNVYQADPVPLFTSGQVLSSTNGCEVVYAYFPIGAGKHSLLGLYQETGGGLWQAKEATAELFESPVLQAGVSLWQIPANSYGWVCIRGSDETIRVRVHEINGWDLGYKAFTSEFPGYMRTAIHQGPILGQVPISGIVQLEQLPTAGAARVQLLYPQANF